VCTRRCSGTRATRGAGGADGFSTTTSVKVGKVTGIRFAFR
jgi:hypothetical protein